jgi:predicted ATP-grasp superfamily ATP-dependent carboligase
MVLLGAHTTPRELVPVFNSPELKQALSQYNLGKNMDYQTPPGQRPTLNSFLLWTARQRKKPAVSLWVPIPFYLVAVEDPNAQRKILEFLDRRLNLNIDFSDIDEEARKQNEKLERVRASFPEINDYISKLESNMRLSEKENEELAKQIQEALTPKGLEV